MKYFIDMYRRYVDFTGRSTRMEYWCAYGIWTAIFAVMYIIVLAIIGVLTVTPSQGTFGALGILELILIGVLVIFILGSCIPMLAIQVRRLRDAGFAWWYLLICYVGNCFCGLGSIALIILSCMPTKEEPWNQQ